MISYAVSVSVGPPVGESSLSLMILPDRTGEKTLPGSLARTRKRLRVGPDLVKEMRWNRGFPW